MNFKSKNVDFLLLKLLLVSVFLLPSTAIFYFISFSLISLVLLPKIKLNKFNLIVCSTMFLIFIVGGSSQAHTTGAGLSIENVFKIILIIYLICASTVSGIDSKPEDIIKIKKTISFILILIISSQIVIMLNIEPIKSIIRDYYLNSDILINIYQREFHAFSSRNGGLFGNPNQLSKAVTFIYIIYLSTSTAHSSKNDLIFSLLCIVSIALSGSRTGFAILFMTSFLFFFLKLNVRGKIAIILTTFVGLSVVFYNELRVVSYTVDSNEIGSLEYKIYFLINYLEKIYSENIISVLFGSGFMDRGDLDNDVFSFGLNLGFDSDIGYIISFLGGVGFIFLIINIFIMWFNGVIKTYMLPIFLWCVSSSVFYNVKSLIMLIIIVVVSKTIFSRGTNEKACIYNKYPNTL